ncbi:MAG: alkyl hydroperoxide reductase subunit F [Spongiibacteraceae bacterium]
MLDAKLKGQLKAYMEKLVAPIEIVASIGTDAPSLKPKALELQSLLREIAELSPSITYRENADANERTPSFAIARKGEAARVGFAGIPMGHEFTSLILALLQVSGYAPKIDEAQIEQIKNLNGKFVFETYISLSCQICPDVVQALNVIAALNPNAQSTMIDGSLFQDEVNARKIMAVPTVYLNGEPFSQGRITLEEILAKIDTGAGERAAEEISAKAPFDMLIVGGGPAGASAAIYAARKGIRTGVVAERFGGQLLDTVGIENFISVKATEGPKLVANLEAHVKEYEVDVMTNQRAKKLIAAQEEGGLIEIELENGARVQSRSVLLATGARWREMNVPGEKEFRGRGVAYCPHCDGPLFKGKRVAVIGGGNSGIEAAIDLAGIVAHVTVLEFDNQLRADAVLQNKARSLPNVTIITGAQTTEVIGDDKVKALNYKNRATGDLHTVELEGIFVQIGLVPNTDWLKDSVALTQRGEIAVNARGETSVPGVFAAGDVTNSAFKQIIIAMGSGATAALGAFDYLIRTPVPSTERSEVASAA